MNPDELISIVRRGANEAWSLALTDHQLSQFARYAELLVDWNANRMNLTRLTSTHDVAVKHFLDSLAVLKAVEIPLNASLIDVGTGAGLPGLALKIARPDLDVTLLDSTAKKLTFCQAVIDDLGLDGIRTVHARAEDIGKSREGLSMCFDVVVARAVASLDKLLPWCSPFAKKTGIVVALKGSMVSDEMAEARPVAKRLGLRLNDPISIALPEAEEETLRQIVVARVT